MDTTNAVLIAALIMGILLFSSVYIGLHFSKKSAMKKREKEDKEN